MKLRSAGRPLTVVLAGTAVLTLTVGGTAGAAGAFTGKDIKDGSLTGADIKNNSVTYSDIANNNIRSTEILNGTIGLQDLSAAAIAALKSGNGIGSGNWGDILRNNIGSATADLRTGPYAKDFGLNVAPPRGAGSLEIQVANGTSKVAFGNEVDFVGKKVSDIGSPAFSIYTVGENGLNNLPNITLEIDPMVQGTPTATNPTGEAHYSSMVFVPTDASATDFGKWKTYGAAGADGFWYFTNGATATQTGCGQSDDCTLQDALDGLDTASVLGTPKVHSVGVGKGRDSEFHGAVDELKIFGSTYDFEPQGVIKHS